MQSMNLSNQNLAKLPKNLPKKIEGNFVCSVNKLTSLKGSPQKIGSDFYCGENKLTTLEGGPQEVGREFSCRDNKLNTLEGGPKKIGGEFSCRNNKLTIFEIIRYVLETEIGREIFSDFEFDFKKFKKSNNRNRIKMLFEEYK
jgi:hypothetical protein